MEMHQQGLVRILRYPRIWQIREAALKALVYVERPTEETLQAVLRILLDTSAYRDLRILAAHSLGLLAQKYTPDSKTQTSLLQEIRDRLKPLSEEPEAPVLQRAVRRALAAVDSAVLRLGDRDPVNLMQEAL